MNIIADVAGHYKTLVALLAKMPNEHTIFLGDLIDRGPRSKQVVEMIRTRPALYSALKGNHEDMMCEWVLRPNTMYHPEDWMVNGGGATVRSYIPNGSVRDEAFSRPEITKWLLEDATWMDSLPWAYTNSDGLYISHAPWNEHLAKDPFEKLWNRRKPNRMPGYFMVHGHNASKKVIWYSEGENEPYGVNIDASRAEVLTGIHWPSKEIFQEAYRD